jgi:hypothetical protein
MGKRASIAAILATVLCGCTIAPHGSKTTRDVWTYAGNPPVMIRHERTVDRSAGGGALFLMDPSLNNVAIYHTNADLHVGGWFLLGSGTVTVDPQTTGIIGAVGTAAGNIIGAAAKTAVRP